MPKSAYEVGTSADFALTASTAKTVLMIITPSTFPGDLVGFTLSMDGVTATNPSILVEFVRSTNASNSTPGTANTSESANIQQIRGPITTAGFTAFSASTSEPTVLTVVRRLKLTPVGSTLIYDFPLGTSIEWPVSSGLGMRLTPGATVSANARASMIFERG